MTSLFKFISSFSSYNLARQIRVLIAATFVFCAATGYSQVVINEVLASNSFTFADDKRAFSDVIELYNSSGDLVDLSGCYLSDDEDYPEKWIIPSGTTIDAYGFLVFFADGTDAGRHTNFKLNSKGEFLSLYSSDSHLFDSVSFPKQLPDISYGRKPDGGNGWFFFSLPTLYASNITSASLGVTESPVFSFPGGFYTSTQQVALSVPSNSGIIRYTTDGSEPTGNSNAYISPLSIEETTIIRARSFKTDYLSGHVSTNTYFINEGEFTIPVISISTAPENLWDADMGIYVEGNGDCSCGGGMTGNYCCLDWEKPIGIEMYEADGTQAFSQNAGLKIFGSGSRKRIPQRSLSIFARGEYGDTDFDYQIFPEKDYDKCSSFILRSSAHDWCKTLFRDAFMQGLGIDRLEIDYQAYRPSVVFINGEYWGIHNIREKVNEDYLADNHGIDPDRVDILEKDAVVIEGDKNNYNQIISFISSNDMSVDANYNQIAAKIDVDEYIDYLILQMFTANSDWPSNNIKYWRSREEDAKWRWIIYDMDFGFGLDTDKFHDGTYNHLTLDLATDPNGTTWFNPPWATLVIRKMLDNKGFRDMFIQRFAHHLNTTFTTERTLSLIEVYKEGIEAEIPRHIEKWGGAYAYELGYVFQSPEAWDVNIDVMREFAHVRPQIMWQHLKDKFGLNETVSLKITNSDLKGGSVLVDKVSMEDSVFTGSYFRGIPLSLYPIKKDGYTFSGWLLSGLAKETISYISKGDEWNYFDSQAEPGAGWKDIEFDDSSWSSGNAQLGYGDGDESTVINYGSDENAKPITSYYRKGFDVENLSIEELSIAILRDDGAVVYLNGSEIFRTNMPAGDVSNITAASVSVPAVEEHIYHEFEISADQLIAGKNVLAVEIHQSDVSSSDVSFDLEFSGHTYLSSEGELLTNPELNLDMLEDTQVEAVFERNTNDHPLYINEFCAKNDLGHADEYGNFSDWIEIYNAGDNDIDLAGFYLTDSLPSKTLWKIPAGHPDQTSIGPGGFLVLWADGDTLKGPLHLNFKLGQKGEDIGLSADGIHFIDSLAYPEQYSNISYGRCPDGFGDFDFTEQQSPEASNCIPSIVHEAPIEDQLLVYPNPAYSELNIELNSLECGNVTISILDISGRAVYTKRMVADHKSKVKIDMEHLTEGIYFVLVKTNRKVLTEKIIHL